MKSDSDLQHDVLQELDWEHGIEASQIGVTTKDGVVALTGHVPTHTEKLNAEEATKRVHGVKAVANEIEVRPADHHLHDDEEIAAAAVHSLEWDGNVPDKRLQVTVRDGWLMLEGTVDQRFERNAAERAVRHLKGVRGLSNNILIGLTQSTDGGHVDADRVKAAIADALQRSSMVNSAQVEVDISNGVVILTGEVRSRAESEEVERIAWNASDISGVENCIAITPWGSGVMEEWGY